MGLGHTAVGNFEQNRVPRSRRIVWSQQNEIARELYPAFGVTWREGDIGDPPARGTLRVHLEIDTPLEFLVRTHFAESSPAEPERLRGDLDASHFR